MIEGVLGLYASALQLERGLARIPKRVIDSHTFGIAYNIDQKQLVGLLVNYLPPDSISASAF